MSNLTFKNGVAAAQQWKKFGIDVRHFPSDNAMALILNGEYDVSGLWPALEPWGAGVDLYRTLDFYNSEYIKPVGTNTQGHGSRWFSKELDSVIRNLRNSDPTDRNKTVSSGIKGLKILVENMPGIPTFGYIGFATWDEAYWTNWPGSENPYAAPYVHWGTFKYVTPRLEQVKK
jgi:peptide/nickel transport system substrate-binding protein